MSLEKILSSVKKISKKIFNSAFRKPLLTFLTISALAVMPVINGCEPGGYTGPVYDDVNDIEVAQVGGGWGWTAEFPDWIFCRNAGGGVPDDSKVNSTGFNIFAKFIDPNNYYIDVNGLPVRITNESGDYSVLGAWHLGDLGWTPNNCVNGKSYSGTCFLDEKGDSLALVTNGICQSWPIGGLFHTGTGSYGKMIGELGSTFRIVDKTGEFTIYCPAASKLVGAKATYNFRKTTTDYWFWNDWGPQCKQNFEKGAAAMSATSSSLDNLNFEQLGMPAIHTSLSSFKKIHLDPTPNLASLEAARSEKGVIEINPDYSNKSNPGLEALVRSRPIIKKSTNNRVINPADYEPITKFDIIKSTVMGALGAESGSEEPLFAFHTRDQNEIWEAQSFYWTDSFNKPAGTEGIDFTSGKFSKYGQTVLVKRVDKNMNIISLHKVKFFPVNDYGDFVEGWSNDIVPSWTQGSEGIYLPQDPNVGLEYARTVIPVQKGDRISSLMMEPDAPFTIDDLMGMSERWLDRIDNPNVQYWDSWYDKNSDGEINFKDFAIGARNWAPFVQPIDKKSLSYFVFCYLSQNGEANYDEDIDFNKDGIINLKDFSYIAKDWNGKF